MQNTALPLSKTNKKVAVFILLFLGFIVSNSLQAAVKKVDSGSFQQQTRTKQQITRATIGKGNITVKNDVLTGKDSTQNLNRDITKAQEITRDDSSNIDLYYSDSSTNVIGSTLNIDGYDGNTLGNVLNPEAFIAGVTPPVSG